jgi:hypothetical protein
MSRAKLLIANVPVDCKDDYLRDWIEARGYQDFHGDDDSRFRERNLAEFRASRVDGHYQTWRSCAKPQWTQPSRSSVHVKQLAFD